MRSLSDQLERPKSGKVNPGLFSPMGLRLWLRHRGKRAAGSSWECGAELWFVARNIGANRKSNGEWFYFPGHLPARIKGTRSCKTQAHSANPKVWRNPLPQLHPSQVKTLLYNSNKAQLSLFNHPVGSEHKPNCQGDAIWFSPCTTSWFLGSTYLTDRSTSNSASRLARTARCRVLQKKTKLKITL